MVLQGTCINGTEALSISAGCPWSPVERIQLHQGAMPSCASCNTRSVSKSYSHLMDLSSLIRPISLCTSARSWSMLSRNQQQQHSNFWRWLQIVGRLGSSTVPELRWTLWIEFSSKDGGYLSAEFYRLDMNEQFIGVIAIHVTNSIRPS